MRVGVVGNPRYDRLGGLLSRITAKAAQHGCHVLSEQSLADHWPEPVPVFDPFNADESIDALLTFGGDGTLLRAARATAGRDIPLLGVNLGRVGFLTSVTPDALDGALDVLFEGRYTVEERRTLSSTIHSAVDAETDGAFAFNDVVVHKQGVARVLSLRVMIDGEEIGQYSADGIIVATPTGSTAYSMSAGGPIVAPGVNALVVTAICPHTLAVRPIVVPGSAVIQIRQAPPFTDKVLVSYDGQVDSQIDAGGAISVRMSDAPTKLIRVGEPGFFATVRQKLQWGDLADRQQG